MIPAGDQPAAPQREYPIPPPTLSPDCRAQRRLAFRNERHLYHRKSDLSGKQIISCFSPDKLTKVFSQDEWWSDAWDPLEYGRDFDFSRPFFEQFAELLTFGSRGELRSRRDCVRASESPAPMTRTTSPIEWVVRASC